MMDWHSNVKVEVRQNFPTDRLEIYIIEESHGETYLANWQKVSDGPCELEFKKVESFGCRVDPTITLPRGIANIFLAAISEFALSEGVKPARHERLEGVLEAQDKHLQDMRRITGNALKVNLEDKEK